jgi:hypothetical protein
MKNNKSLITVFCLALAILVLPCCAEKGDVRRNTIKFMESIGMDKQLRAGVHISNGKNGMITISDKGNYFVQYKVLTPAVSCDPNITIESDVLIQPTVNKAVIVTHGWIDKAEQDWPAQMTKAIAEKVDPNEWLCASFDWRKGSVALNPVEAAEYARDIAGPRLTAALKSLPNEFKHIHIIAHSAGAWVAGSAAKTIAKAKPNTQIHLTFLDAYLPPKWSQQELGQIDSNAPHWAEHYYSKDITMNVTDVDLANAHNVDVTKIDSWFKEHQFPYHWYLATIKGQYQRKMEQKIEVVDTLKGTKYGFARSLEAGVSNFKKSLTLETGNKAVKLKKPSKTK